MFDIGSIPRDLFLSCLQAAAPLSVDQAKALRDELSLDPEGRGYASAKNVVETLRLLCLPYEIPNPEEQGYIVVKTKEDPALSKLLIEKGVLTQAELEEERKILDPAWPAVLSMPARSDVVLGGGMVPSLEEISEAMA